MLFPFCPHCLHTQLLVAPRESLLDIVRFYCSSCTGSMLMGEIVWKKL